MPALADRCKDTTTTTGIGTVTITGTPPTGFVGFSSVYAVGDTVPYAIIAQTGGEWEVGLGTLASSTTITREQVFSSSNSNALVSFSSGTKDVFADLPASLVNDYFGMAMAMQMNWILQ
jgi:hypothetical protein